MSHVVDEQSPNVDNYKGGVANIYKHLGFSLDLQGVVVNISEQYWIDGDL
jgi:hypothetical protein